MRFWILFVALMVAGEVNAQNFSCSYGKRASCLDYGDTVCSSRGKCVDSNAACFNNYQCDYEGFTCKSNVTECVDSRNELVDDYDTLVRKYNVLLNEYDDLLEKAKKQIKTNNRMKECLAFASDLEAAQACEWY